MPEWTEARKLGKLEKLGKLGSQSGQLKSSLLFLLIKAFTKKMHTFLSFDYFDYEVGSQLKTIII